MDLWLKGIHRWLQMLPKMKMIFRTGGKNKLVSLVVAKETGCITALSASQHVTDVDENKPLCRLGRK